MLNILPPSEYQEIYENLYRPLPSWDICIHQAVADRGAQTPDSLAVCAWDGDFTFQELDQVASRVAKVLVDSGAKQGSTVAFLFNKSKWTIVSVLAIFKAGAAAVALNSEYPMERMKKITELAQTRIALVGEDLKDMLQIPEVEVIIVGDKLPHQEQSSAQPVTSFASSDVHSKDMAYIQFTSGSSGQPKGIVIEHGSFLANAMGHLEVIQLSKDSRTLHCAAHTFDAFLTETMMTLLAGGCICIPSEERRMNDLAGAARDLRVNWMGMTPTLAKILAPQDVPSVKTLCLWGEPAPRELIATWADAVELINCYGPSENSVGATTHSFSRGSRSSSCIGKPMTTVNAWITRPGSPDILAPIGSVGELVLQGSTVARGYLNEPEKNKHSFRKGAPWLPKDVDPRVQRIYLTGDLVRYNTDGTLDFIGRQDTAVKIRGQRIELGEIEHNINHSGGPYSASVVMVIGTPAFSIERLVAFVCNTKIGQHKLEGDSLAINASQGSREEAIKLENHLGKVLTRAAVPSIYIPLRQIPTLPSGKVDRQKLLALVSSMSEDQLASYSTQAPSVKEAPVTENEETLARLWAEVLSIEAKRVSRHDNFFYLGGNSILAMRLTVAARKQDVSITVAQVLSNLVLKDLAPLMVPVLATQTDVTERGYSPFSSVSGPLLKQFIENVVTRKLSVEIDDIEDIGLATDYQIENLAWSSLKKRGGTNYITFDFPTNLDPQLLQSAFGRLQAHHAILRTVYFAHHRRVFQVALKKVSLQVTHLVNTPDTKAATTALMEEDLRQPLDIGNSLVKLWFIIVDGGVSRLVLRASHLQYDGVVLIRWAKELGLAYNSLYKLGTAPSFPNYTYFAANHNAAQAQEFWRDLLAGSKMTRVFDHKSIPWKHVLDGQVDTMIDSKLLQCHASITGGTVIKASWALVLAEMAETDDVVFGSVVWGRNAPFPEVESVAGACINNIPVRARLHKAATHVALLQQVQDQYFEAVDYECYQYKRIVSECTDWKPWERLSTLVEYENLGEDTSSFPMNGDQRFTVDEIRPPADRHDITIYSMPLGDQTFIALDYCASVVPEAVAQVMLDRMIFHITSFKENINGVINLSKPSSMPSLPLPLPSYTPINSFTKRVTGSAPIISVNEESRDDGIARLVEHAWSSILSCKRADTVTFRDHQTPFFEVWGDLIAAVGLAKYYMSEGFSVSMEDILQNPDMASQEELLRIPCHKAHL